MPHEHDIPPEHETPDAAAPDAAAPDAAAPERSGLQQALRYVLITLGSLVGTVLLLLLLFVLALQTNWGAARFGDFVLGLANPFDQTLTRYDEIRGNFLTGVELYDLQLFRPDTVRTETLRIDSVEVDGTVRLDTVRLVDVRVDTLLMAQIDTFRVRYDLLALLEREVHLDELYVGGPDLIARQQPDSTWDLLAPFTPDTTVEQTRLFDFALDRIRLTNGTLLALYDPPRPDSALRVADVNARVDQLVLAEALTVFVDTLWGQYQLPQAEDWTFVRAGGSLLDDRLDVDGLTLQSPYSEVAAAGSLRLPAEAGDPIENIDFRLTAEPLAFRDLHPFLPALDPGHQLFLELQAGGSSRVLALDAEARFQEGSALTLEGTFTPSFEDALDFEAEGRLRQFDPSLFLTETTEPPGRLNADFTVDLEGASLETLDGVLNLLLFDTRLAGYNLDRTTLEAVFDDGQARFELESGLRGSRLLAEGTARPFADVPTYDVEGRFLSVNIGRLLDSPAQTSNISGRFRVEGYGIQPETAEVEAEVNLYASTINDYRIEDARLNLTLEGGDLQFGTRVLLPDGLIAAQGAVAFEDPLRYEITRGRFENVDVAALLGNPRPSAFTGTFTLQGRGLDPETATLTGDFDLARSTLGDLVVRQGTADLRLQDGDLRFDVDFRSNAGTFAFLGRGTFADGRVTYRVREGRFEHLDLGAFTGDPAQASDLTGTFSLTGRGTDPRQLVLDADLQLAQGRYDEVVINEGAADVALRAGRLTFDAYADLAQGSFDVAGTARPFLARPRLEITEGRLRNVDVGAFFPEASYATDLTGTFTLTAQGTSLEDAVVEARLDLLQSVVNEQEIREGQLTLALERGQLTYAADVRTPEGRLALTGTGDLLADRPLLALDEGTFEGVDLGALLGLPDLQTHLNGTLVIQGEGLALNAADFDPAGLDLDFLVRLRPSTLNGVPVEGRVEVTARNGRVEADALLDFAEGEARLTAAGRFFDARPTYEATGTLQEIDVDALLGEQAINIDTLLADPVMEAGLSLTFTLEGEGTDPETMRLAARLQSDSLRYGDFYADALATDFLLREGLLRVDTLRLASNVADIAARGTVALFDTTAASDFRFRADVTNLAPVRPFLQADVLALEESHVEGRVYGRAGLLRFDADAVISSLVYNDLRLANFAGEVAGELGPERTPTAIEAQGEFAYFSLPQLIIEDTDFTVDYDGDEIGFAVEMVVDQRRDAQVRGVVDLRPDSQRIVLEALNLRFDETRWELLQQASITYGDQYRVNGLLLYSETQQIAVDGVIDPDGTQNLVLTIEDVRIGAFADLLEFDGLAGALSGSLVMTGPAAAPNIEGTLNAELISYDEPVGELSVALAYDSLRMHVEALLTHVDESTLRLDGDVPMDLRLTSQEDAAINARLQAAAPEAGALDLDVVADSFSIGWIQPFLDPTTINRFDGRLTGVADVGGSLDNPVLDGEARLVDGIVGLPEFGVAYTNIRGDFTFSGNRIVVQEALLESGDGTLAAEGTILLEELTLGELDLALRANNFLAVDSPAYRAVTDARLRLRGTTRTPILEGALELLSADIYLTEEATAAELENVELTEADLRALERNFGVRVTEEDTTTFDFYQALAMDLEVNMERDIWLRSRGTPEMNIQFTGALDVRKQPNSDAQVFGTIEVISERSVIIQFGKRFELASGTLTFNGDIVNPLINLLAAYEVPRNEVVITLRVEGRLDDLDLTFGSENPSGLELPDIISYIATGRPASQGLHLGGVGQAGVVGAGTDIVFSQLTAFVEGVAGEELGLDIIEIEQNGFQGTTITAGKYVSSRLFISISQPISYANNPGASTTPGEESRRALTLEYELYDWLLLRAMRQGSVLRINLLWEYAY